MNIHKQAWTIKQTTKLHGNLGAPHFSPKKNVRRTSYRAKGTYEFHTWRGGKVSEIKRGDEKSVESDVFFMEKEHRFDNWLVVWNNCVSIYWK